MLSCAINNLFNVLNKFGISNEDEFILIREMSSEESIYLENILHRVLELMYRFSKGFLLYHVYVLHLIKNFSIQILYEKVLPARISSSFVDRSPIK
jgi:hypothetical protein